MSSRKKKKRAMRSNVNGQEEMVGALWDFARDVLALPAHSFVDGSQHFTRGQHEALKKAMQRISAGYGYRIVEIQ